ncbi:hypothetical protein [Microbacterium tumbae]
MSGQDNRSAAPRQNGGGSLGVRTVDIKPPEVRALAKAFIGVVIARRYEDRDTANTQMASYPSRHTPTPRRRGTDPVE